MLLTHPLFKAIYMTHMIDKITSPNNFEDAYRKTQRGKAKYKPSAIVFSRNETRNLENIRQEVISGTYSQGDYNEFTVYEPKERVIYSPQHQEEE